MSATPFQLHEGELKTLFSVAEDLNKSLSSEVIERIYGENILNNCVSASHCFELAWHELEDVHLQKLQEMMVDEPGRLVISSRLKELAYALTTPGSLKTFAKRVLDYRQSIDILENELSKVVIRHEKIRNKRDYHIGQSYRFDPVKTAVKRKTLYATNGYMGLSDGDAFIQYMAIRLDQKIRQSDCGSLEVNARLMRGMTSGIQAFKSSHAEICQDPQLDEQTREYQKLFFRLLHIQGHPKIKATAERAYQNYLLGRKTLVFCERVDTLNELTEQLKQKIGNYTKTLNDEPGFDAGAVKKAVQAKPLFVDNYWWRSLIWILPDDQRMSWVESHRIVWDTKLEDVKAKTDRQAIRIGDIQLFKAFSQELNSYPDIVFPNAIALFLELTDTDTDYIGCKGDAEIEEEDYSEKQAEPFSYFEEPCLWFSSNPDSREVHIRLWRLLEYEAQNIMQTFPEKTGQKKLRCQVFAELLVNVMKGLRKIALREDLLVRYLGSAKQLSREEAIQNGFFHFKIGDLTICERLIMFLDALLDASGSISTSENTKRLGLWKGVFRKEKSVVDTLSGDRDAATRVTLCSAFNSPLAPDILICTAIGSEGIDLHRQCAEVIHHDLPWNPAKMEQRTGRIDRVGALGDVMDHLDIQVGIPFLEHNYEKVQYDVVWSRAQRFEVLMGGKLDFDLEVEEDQEILDNKHQIGADRKILSQESDKLERKIYKHLPVPILNHLRVDLGINGVGQ